MGVDTTSEDEGKNAKSVRVKQIRGLFYPHERRLSWKIIKTLLKN